MLGVVDDVLADRAFVEQRQRSAAELGTVADLASPAPHFVANALAAAALARAHGVPPVAVRDGLRSFSPDGHRIADVGAVGGVRYVDDSKATNPHAAASSLLGLRARGVGRRRAGEGRVVRRPRRSRCATGCAASCCSGSDRAVIAEALRRHAPDVPVIEVADGGDCQPWTAWSGRPPTSPSRATRCCWPRAARPWTCSRTTALAGMPSPSRCTGCRDALTAGRGRPM